MRVLLVKMSSLGDVVHALPAVTDAGARGARFDWVVEEAFADIPRRHPAVERVLPIAWRRWRRGLASSRRELGEFVRLLRRERYDIVLDAQGLIKSAAVTALARAPVRAGFGFTSAREPVAAFAWTRRVPVPIGGHAVDRLRSLFAGALDYSLPDTAADFGLATAAQVTPARRCLLLHGTTWESKHWPVGMWRVLAGDLASTGWQVELPWGDTAERDSAERIAEGLTGVRVLDRLSLTALTDRLAGAGLVVGVDSGLAHLAGALGVPAVVIYGSTSATRTGVRGTRVESLQSELHCAPCLSRRCSYRGETLRWQGEAVSPPCYALLPPERVRAEAVRLLERSP